MGGLWRKLTCGAWHQAVILVLLVAGTARAAAFHPYFGWRTIDTEHFSVHYHNELEEAAQKAAELLEEAHAELSPKYEWKPWGRTQVILTDAHDDANGMASTLPYNWMLLRVVPPDPESSLSLYDDWLKTLIFHEYTHILHLDAYGGFWRPWRWVFGKMVAPAGLTPGWIREGTATLEETEGTQGGRGRAGYSEMLIRSAVLLEKFPPIDRAAGVHWKWPAAQTQYIFGVKFLQWLEKKFGTEKVQKFHRRTQRSLFIGAINHQAKNIFGKSYYKLWKEWQAELKLKYEAWEKERDTEGWTQMDLFLGGEDLFHLPVFSRDGKKLATVRLNPRRAARLVVRDLESQQEIEAARRKAPGQISFSPDGRALVFSTMGRHRRHYFYSDLYQVDLSGKKHKLKRLTRGERARDPDWHPQRGQILFVASDRGTDTLKIYDLESKQSRPLVSRVAPYTQFAHPRWASDGTKFAVVRWIPKEGWHLVVAGSGGNILEKIHAEGFSVMSRPAWMPDSQTLIYSSDEDGVFNLYAFHLKTKKKERLTNVRTGLFQPAVSPADGKLLARHYHGEGFDLVEVTDVIARTMSEAKGTKQSKGQQREIASPPSAVRNDKGMQSDARNDKGMQSDARNDKGMQSDARNDNVKKYNAFRQSLFLPRLFAPGWYVLDNGLLVSLATAAHDPLGYHNWVGGGTYRTDARHFGYFGRYSYNRFLPGFGIGVDDFAVDYGTITFARTNNSYHFFEERRRGSVFFNAPLGKGHAASLSYFYEDRLPVTGITAAEAGDLDLGIFAGIFFSYFYGSAESYPASISPVEKGRVFRATATVTDARLGGREPHEQRIYTGDYREFLPLGKNHVLALKVAGGAATGDALVLIRTFSFGGSLGEGALAGVYSSRYFSFRGLPVGTLLADRVMTSSLEYRIPLASPQRGLGTWPFFVNNLHLALFSDQGDAWNNTPGTFGDFFDNFFVSTGIEGRADFVLGHGLPVTGRMGYAVVVVNRDRLGNLSDPFLGNRVRNGIFILQFGTSF